jgi:hypothetical protein
MLRRHKYLYLVLAVFLLVGVTQQSHAVLNAVGPNDPNNHYPTFYQDGAAISLQACLSGAEILPGIPMCLLTVTPPVIPFGNFPDEFFYFLADTSVPTAFVPAGSVRYRAALEGAFANAVVDTGQITFARIRVRVDVPAPGGNYRVIHPYGVLEFPNVSPGVNAINFTDDVGVGGPPPVFTGALAGAIGPFLNQSATPGGAALPPIDVNGELFIGNPNALTKVTGSPFFTNFVRVEGPNVGGPGINSVEVSDFNLSGQLFTGAVATPLAVSRATYTRGPVSGHVDVFATSAPTATVSITGGPNLPGGSIPIPGNGLGSFFTALQLPDATVLPAGIIVTATNPGSTDALVSANLTDEVLISQAVFDDVTGSLIIKASSTDSGLTPPTLTAVGFGVLTPDTAGTQSLVVPNIAGPPPSVTVQSTAGGSATKVVQIGLPPPPVEALSLISATFRVKTHTWRVKGHTTIPGATIRILNTANLATPLLGKATANSLGLWSFTLKGALGKKLPNAAKRISVRSSGGDTVVNKRVTIIP